MERTNLWNASFSLSNTSWILLCGTMIPGLQNAIMLFQPECSLFDSVREGISGSELGVHFRSFLAKLSMMESVLEPLDLGGLLYMGQYYLKVEYIDR
jgi:hypothetical protein